MCQYVAVDGFPSDWHVVHLGARAIGGAGVVFAEATGVTPEGRLSHGCTGIWKDDHIPAWKRVVEAIKSNGSVAAIQLAHSGRKGSTHPSFKDQGRSLSSEENPWQTLAPSSIVFGGNISHVPKEVTEEDIETLKVAFRDAARRAHLAGFDVLEIHGAHGYLMDQFLSPLTNKRTDKYGGSLDNRARFVEEVIQEVKKEWPSEKPLLLRLSCIDWADGGKTLEDTIYYVQKFTKAGVDLIDCSSGFVVPETMKNIKFGPSFQVPFADEIKKRTGTLTAAVGGISEAEEANDIIEKGKADLVLVGTHFLRDPFFAYHAALALGESHTNASQLLPIQTGFYLRKPRIVAATKQTNKL
eukprot:TRINITY_DN17296_c0_g1_i1.p1 TRINITY_DN17296_c0_g1~~TRINITY_DN17296_c0_g1_i1.p1  ORF type:complete len:406 (-),score=76.84 TRINITY_DN17296_c0_g1_i1:1-1065(-)